ncbi:hypothetical protein SPRG_13913 [Saprolegnia parasitica CBS 223.65]|uniref:EF-hand domain-containing protein n=1 Tax=Saprolegnia parasitica (strain CBS 223.65) TaxID=695850 RepID=A0A067C2E8_SAPPC|nr:hypothetical protein SPRG_13913 [Saprolegnia parasitica CBS 223.65]KDO20701.1 hypothetical protein SPRG_13913 [Saprolegnia parasitica CBS 223.65]|eukprot:XP_012208584.1 hypothetical protein SPRG_13913 [Saprolegnia parasitica CBS 223.65]
MSKAEYRALKARLRHECSQRRIRLEEFMKTFDVHKTKKVTTDQFARALDASGVRLSRAEVELLLQKYRVPDAPRLVDYRRFCDLIDKSCTAKDLEKKFKTKLSLETVRPTQTGAFTKQLPTSESEVAALRSITEQLARAVRIKGIVLKDVFHDFDKNNSGFVTQARFTRDLFGILGDVDPSELRVLIKVYGAGLDVNYKLLHHDLTDGVFPAYSNNGVNASPRAKRRGGNQYGCTEADAIEGPLREIAARDRIRVKNFFTDYDRMRSGKCTEAQFMRAVKVCFGALTQSDLDVLVAKYAVGIVDVSHERKVDYIAFCKSITLGETHDEANELENNDDDRDSLSVDVPTLPSAACSRGVRGVLSDTELVDWHALMRRLSFSVTTRRIALKPAFTDFDRGKTECVTCEQFARVLALFNLHVVSPAEKHVVLKRYASTRLNSAPVAQLAFDNKAFVNYKTFCLDLDGYDESMQRPASSEPVKRGGMPKVTDDAPSEANVQRTLPMLLRYIKQKAKRDRLRVEEYFRDFDRLRKGKITRAQYGGGLHAAGFILSPEDLDLLASAFPYQNEVDVEGASMVAWTRFVDEVEAVFTVKGLEREPTKDIPHAIEAAEQVDAITDTALSARDEAIVMASLQTMLSRMLNKRLDIKPSFEDFDLANQGFISHTKFERVLSVFQLLPADAPTCRALCIKFSERGNAPMPGVSSTCDVNYRAFLHALSQLQGGATRVPGAREYRLQLAAGSHMDGNAAAALRRSKVTPHAVRLPSLLKDLRLQVDAKRVRIKQFFAESDRLRTGDITVAKFHTAINRCGLVVNADDVHTLNAAFASTSRPDQIDYRAFLQAIEATSHTEDCRDEVPAPERSPALDALLSRIRTAVEFRRLNMKPYFEDYDHNFLMHVTKTQFAAVLNLMRIELSPAETSLLTSAFAVHHGRQVNPDVHYLRFLEAVDPVYGPVQ